MSKSTEMSNSTRFNEKKKVILKEALPLICEMGDLLKTFDNIYAYKLNALDAKLTNTISNIKNEEQAELSHIEGIHTNILKLDKDKLSKEIKDKAAKAEYDARSHTRSIKSDVEDTHVVLVDIFDDALYNWMCMNKKTSPLTCTDYIFGSHGDWLELGYKLQRMKSELNDLKKNAPSAIGDQIHAYEVKLNAFESRVKAYEKTFQAHIYEMSRLAILPIIGEGIGVLLCNLGIGLFLAAGLALIAPPLSFLILAVLTLGIIPAALAISGAPGFDAFLVAGITPAITLAILAPAPLLLGALIYGISTCLFETKVGFEYEEIQTLWRDASNDTSLSQMSCPISENLGVKTGYCKRFFNTAPKNDEVDERELESSAIVNT